MRRELHYHRVATNARREAIQAIIEEYLRYEEAIAINGCSAAEKMYWYHPCEQLMNLWIYWQNRIDGVRMSLEGLPEYCERIVKEDYRNEYGRSMGTRFWGAWESDAADGITRGRHRHRHGSYRSALPRANENTG